MGGTKNKHESNGKNNYSANLWVEKYWKKMSGNGDRERGGDIVLDCVVKKSFTKVRTFELWSNNRKKPAM